MGVLCVCTVYLSELWTPRTPSLHTPASRPSRARWGANTTSSLRRALRWSPRVTVTWRRRIISRTITWLAQAKPRAGDTLEDRGLRKIKKINISGNHFFPVRPFKVRNTKCQRNKWKVYRLWMFRDAAQKIWQFLWSSVSSGHLDLNFLQL